MNENGAILWENDKLVFVVTGLKSNSTNIKTGKMLQSWIMLKEMAPTEAVRTGQDKLVCGNCPLRGDGTGKKRSCYVNLVFGPNAIWKTLGKYCGDVSKLKDSIFRFGAWGDPAFVPISILKPIAKQVRRFTGYTHQWRGKRFQAHKAVCMASVETLAGKKEANEKGWRTFRVTSDLATKTPDEVICPASDEHEELTGRAKITCAQCGLCNGQWSGKKKNVLIRAHGSPISAGKHALALAE